MMYAIIMIKNDQKHMNIYNAATLAEAETDAAARRRVMEQLKTEAAPVADDGAPPTSLLEDQA